MVQQARNKVISVGGQLPVARLVEEYVFAVLEQGHIGVHAAAVDAEDGLGHKGGVQAVFLRQRLDGQLEGHDIVGRGQRLGVFEIDFVLTGGHLMVGGFNLKAHGFQRHADFAARALAMIQRAQVKVARFVVGCGGGFAVLIGLEQEKLALRAYVKAVAHIGGLLEHPAQRAARIADKGRAVGIVYVADQPRDLAVLRTPGQDGEGVQIGM